MDNHKFLVMGSKQEDLVVFTKSGQFVFIGNENFFFDKDLIHCIVPANSNDFQNYFEASERLKYMKKYLEEKDKLVNQKNK